MENAKESIFKQFINFFKSFTNSESVDNGRVNEAELSPEDKKLLKEMRKMDKVENIREKYGASVSTTVAKENAAKAKTKGKEIVEKAIDEK